MRIAAIILLVGAIGSITLLSDGHRATAVPLPDLGGRFIDRNDHVEDTKTGLLWQKDGTASGKLDFYAAGRYAAGLKLGGMTGWRVPLRQELAGIFPATEAPFTNT